MPRINEIWVLLGVNIMLLSLTLSSIQSANWVQTPALILIASVGALTTLAASYRLINPHRLHIVSALVGICVGYAYGLSLIPSLALIDRFSELNYRLYSWILVIFGNDVTTDTLPLSILIVVLTWLISYFTSWFLIHHKWVWTTILTLGSVLIINLTYVPKSYSIYLFSFISVVLLLIVYINTHRYEQYIKSENIPHPRFNTLTNFGIGILMSGLALITALSITIPEDSPTPLKQTFRPINRYVNQIRVEFQRIFAAVPTYRSDSIRFFDRVLPLIRSVPKGNETVFLANARLPLYWPAIAYDEYTSTAWRVDDIETKPVTLFESSPLAGEEQVEEITTLGPNAVSYTIQMFVDSPYMMVAGAPIYLDPKAEQQIPNSTTYEMVFSDTATPSDNLPQDVKSWLHSINGSVAETGNIELAQIPSSFIIKQINKTLNGSSRDTKISIDTNSPDYYKDLRAALEQPGTIKAISFQRAIATSSPISYKPLKTLQVNKSYDVVSELTSPTEQDLLMASEDIPHDIIDRYTNLPKTLPERVTFLSKALTKDATNTYEKALNIESYLRELTYVPKSSPLPHKVDVVDHFLFEDQSGYSDYFASAMAVMLRAIDIPTRVILGFGPGEENPDQSGFTVRDKDNHVWPEVFFTNIGWVPFEPTPIYPTRVRATTAQRLAMATNSGIGGMQKRMLAGPSKLDTSSEDKRERDDLGGPLSGGQGAKEPPFRHFGSPLGKGGLAFILSTLGILFLSRLVWIRIYGPPNRVADAFSSMRSLAKFLGLSSNINQTPYEFANNFSNYIPDIGSEIEEISDKFVLETYGAKNQDSTDLIQIRRTWKSLKQSLLKTLKNTT